MIMEFEGMKELKGRKEMKGTLGMKGVEMSVRKRCASDARLRKC